MFLVAKFQQFHAELMRLSAKVGPGAWSSDGDAAFDRGLPESSPVAIRRALVTLLERQAMEAGREGGDVAVDLYRRAQYAMAALADEVFLHMAEWSGRDAWREDLIEARLFNSRRAGEELFERIDDLLRERDGLHTELARIYLTVLALGFQGKYRGQRDAEQELADYRRRLYRFIFGRAPQALHGKEPLVPQTYLAAIHNERRGVKVPYLRPWVVALVLIATAWLASSQLIWRYAVAELAPLVTQIRELAAEPRTASQPGRL